MVTVGIVKDENSNVIQCRGPDGLDPLVEGESEWKHVTIPVGSSSSTKRAPPPVVVQYDIKWKGYSGQSNVDRNYTPPLTMGVVRKRKS